MDFVAYLRKSLASLTLMAMVATFAAPIAQAGVEEFTDVAEIPSWGDEAIEELMDMGVLAGNDDGSFAPNRQLVRAEVAKIIVLATGIDFDTSGGPHFPDVPENAWFYDYVETMYNYGWINGYPDGYFRPGVGINRAEIAKMVINAFEIDQDLAGAPHFDDVDESDWFYGYVETAYNYGLMRGYGDGTFGPANAVTRVETAKIVYDALLVVSEPEGPAEGTLEVQLSADTPRGTNIPFNATSVPFTTVEMTASDDSDVEVSTLTFTRLGLGDNDDFDNVWLEVDGFKIGNDKSVNNDDIVELRFNPPLIVPAGQTVVADVVASMETSAAVAGGRHNTGHHNRFALISGDDIVSTAANVVGDFPIEGEEMEVADYEVSQIRFSSLGSDSTVDVGDNFIEVGKFRLLNDSNTNKDVELRAVTFKNDGTAELEDDLENVSLYVSGEQVSAETIVDGDYLTFRLDNGVTGGYIIEDGDSRIFSIRADIVSAEKDDTINLKVDNFEDIVGVEVGTSFGVKAVAGDSGFQLSGSGQSASTTSASCTAGSSAAEDDCARLKAYVIDSGDLNVSRDPSSIGNQEYAPGSNDVVFLTARVVVDQPMIVDGLTIHVETGSNVLDKSDTNTTADNLDDFNVAFDNFRLYLNDKLVDSENDFTLRSGGSDGTVTDYELVFNTTFEIAGTSILKLVGNAEDDAETGDKLKVMVSATDFEAPEYISTGDQVQSNQLLGSATGSFVEIEKSVLTITRTDGLSDNDKIVAGVDDVTFLKFVLDNNDSGDVVATSVTIGAITSGAATTVSNFTAALFVDGTQQGSAKNLENTSNEATFNDINVVIPSAGQKEFTVVMDTIEASADSNGGETTVAAGTGTEPTAVTDLNGAADASASTGGSTITLGTALTSAVAANSQVVITTGTTVGTALTGAAPGDSPEIRTVAAAAAIGDTTITVTEAFAAGHTGEKVWSVVTNYPGTAGSFTVASTNNLEVGDVIDITDATGGVNTSLPTGDTDTDDFCISAISGNVLTIGVSNATGTGCSTDPATADTLGADVALGNAVVEVSGDSEIRLTVKAVEADNVENGQDVDIEENGVALAAANTSETNTLSTSPTVTAGADCESAAGAASNNYLCGVKFALIQSGNLSTSVESTVFSDILIAEEDDVEVLRIRFNASDDEIHVRDIFLENVAGTAAGDRVDFKLYNAAGQLVQMKQMTSGKLHFELANQDRIRVPKDDSTFVTVKVDVRNITEANQTGKQLQLQLSDTEGTAIATGSTDKTGIEAVTAATGSDLDAGATGSTKGSDSVKGENFVIYRSEMTVRHASSQPDFSDPTAAFQPVYDFVVTADQARQIELGLLTFNVDLSGMNIDGTTAATTSTPATLAGAAAQADHVIKIEQVKADGTVDDSADVADVVLDGLVADDAAVVATATFKNQKIAKGTSRTYRLSVRYTEQDGGSDADDDAVSVTIVRDTAYSAPDDRAGQVGTPSVLVWSDESDSNHTDSTNDWLNGYLVEIDTTALVNND